MDLHMMKQRETQQQQQQQHWVSLRTRLERQRLPDRKLTLLNKWSLVLREMMRVQDVRGAVLPADEAAQGGREEAVADADVAMPEGESGGGNGVPLCGALGPGQAAHWGSSTQL